jgi:hypothetical protein
MRPFGGGTRVRYDPVIASSECSPRTIEPELCWWGDPLPRFWQRRFYDFNVWSLKKRVEKLHYVHMNPLKRKLVDHPKGWPWSSFSFYANPKHGLIRVDPIH